MNADRLGETDGDIGCDTPFEPRDPDLARLFDAALMSTFGTAVTLSGALRHIAPAIRTARTDGSSWGVLAGVLSAVLGAHRRPPISADSLRGMIRRCPVDTQTSSRVSPTIAVVGITPASQTSHTGSPFAPAHPRSPTGPPSPPLAATGRRISQRIAARQHALEKLDK